MALMCSVSPTPYLCIMLHHTTNLRCDALQASPKVTDIVFHSCFSEAAAEQLQVRAMSASSPGISSYSPASTSERGYSRSLNSSLHDSRPTGGVQKMQQLPPYTRVW